jgi:hypothetical protein
LRNGKRDIDMAELIELTELHQILEDYAKDAEEIYKYQISLGGKNASRKLIDNVKSWVVVGENSYEVTLQLQDYWKYIEGGRKAGKFPPVGAIMRWIEVKPIIPRPNDFGKIPTPKQLAFLIGRKIEREGIEPFPALKTTKEELDKLYREKISDALGKDVRNYISKLFGE